MSNENLQTKLLTTHDAAAYIGMSRAFLAMSRLEGHRRNRTPGPPYVRMGRSVRYHIDDLDAWIEANRRQPGEAAERRGADA